MPYDDIGTAEIAQHRGGYLTGVSTLRVLTHVLRAPAHWPTGEQLLRLSEIRILHTHGYLYPTQLRCVAGHRGEQCGVLGKPAMHLPIARNERNSHVALHSTLGRKAG